MFSPIILSFFFFFFFFFFSFFFFFFSSRRRHTRFDCDWSSDVCSSDLAVCFCLGITAVDPVKLGLLFERFLSEDRKEAPDIDVDFAHEEREHVLQYVYEKYGREHAAMVCEQITYRGRSAVRDTARVLGFSVEQADRLATLSDRFSARATAGALRGDESGEDGPWWEDPYAKQTHNERRDPTTALRQTQPTSSVIRQAGLDPEDKRVGVLADLVE